MLTRQLRSEALFVFAMQIWRLGTICCVLCCQHKLICCICPKPFCAFSLPAGLSSSSRSIGGVLHCFTGNGDELRQCLDLGLCIGITGWVCDDRPERGGAELAALLSTIPPDRLMIETDAPYLPPRTILPAKSRPNRNEPALLPHVLTTVAAALGQSKEEVAQRTTDVARKFFGLPASL